MDPEQREIQYSTVKIVVDESGHDVMHRAAQEFESSFKVLVRPGEYYVDPVDEGKQDPPIKTMKPGHVLVSVLVRPDEVDAFHERVEELASQKSADPDVV